MTQQISFNETITSNILIIPKKFSRLSNLKIYLLQFPDFRQGSEILILSTIDFFQLYRHLIHYMILRSVIATTFLNIVS